jgi:hypothetical protein
MAVRMDVLGYRYRLSGESVALDTSPKECRVDAAKAHAYRQLSLGIEREQIRQILVHVRGTGVKLRPVLASPACRVEGDLEGSRVTGHLVNRTKNIGCRFDEMSASQKVPCMWWHPGDGLIFTSCGRPCQQIGAGYRQLSSHRFGQEQHRGRS